MLLLFLCFSCLYVLMSFSCPCFCTFYRADLTYSLRKSIAFFCLLLDNYMSVLGLMYSSGCPDVIVVDEFHI